MICFSVLMASTSLSGQSQHQQIERLITQFSEGGASNDTKLLDPVLSPNFRIVFNDANAGAVKVIDRATYLQLIANKTFGGEKRVVNIESLQIDNNLTATAKIVQKGASNAFHSFMTLVWHKEQWQIVGETVFIAAD